VAKNALFEEILQDYTAKNPDVDNALTRNFCVFVTGWLADHKPIGVGMTSSGLAIRFADGREFSFFAGVDASNPDTVTPSVSVTGNNAGVRADELPAGLPSVSITGSN